MLAVAGGKGGSGKTTTALGIARALARAGLDPVVVDCDSDMPDLHHYAGVQRTGGVDAVAAGRAVRDATRTSPAVPGVRLVPAGSRDNVAPTVRQLGDWHGPVLLDCPPGAGPDASLPLRMAQGTLLVATDRPQSLDDAERTGDAARALGAEPIGLLLRTTSTEKSGLLTVNTPVLAKIPTVETPFENGRVDAGWVQVSEMILKFCETRNGKITQDWRGRRYSDGLGEYDTQKYCQ